jgi:hypothetical protein
MPYPILPGKLSPSDTIGSLPWNTPYQEITKPLQNRFSGGVVGRGRLGINLVNQEIDASFVTRDQVTVDQFLRERRGLPFRLAVENRLFPDSPDLLYSCAKWRWENLGASLGFKFSGKFTQVRVLTNG